MRQGGDDDFTVFFAEHGTGFNTTAPGFIHLTNFFRRCDDLCFGGEVRRLDVGHQVLNGRLGLIQQVDTSRNDFIDIVRRNICGHTHRNTGASVQEHKGYLCGQ